MIQISQNVYALDHSGSTSLNRWFTRQCRFDAPQCQTLQNSVVKGLTWKKNVQEQERSESCDYDRDTGRTGKSYTGIIVFAQQQYLWTRPKSNDLQMANSKLVQYKLMVLHGSVF